MTRFETLLAGCRRHHPRYAGALSDHLPMALCALAALERPMEQIEAFHDRYATRLSALPPDSQPIDQWEDHIGKTSSYGDLLRYFLSSVEVRGIDAVVRAHLPQLVAGLSADAFHPLIRLAYGVDFGHPAEVAAGLAYLAAVHRPLPEPRWAPGDVPLMEVLRINADDGDIKGFRFRERMFSPRMEELLATASIAGPGAPETLTSMAALVVQLHLNTRDFFALHLVTACHALRLCLPFLDDVEGAIGHFQRAVVAAHAVIGAPDPMRRHLSDEAWLARMARDPEHVYKYGYTCRQELEHYGNPTYMEEFRRLERAGLLEAPA